MEFGNSRGWDGQDRRRQSVDEDMLRTVVMSVMEAMPKPDHACLNDDEQRWVRQAIEAQADRAKLRKAIIEKTFAGLIWAGILGIGAMFMSFLKDHGWK